MKLSIIIPVLNEAAAIKACLIPLAPLRRSGCEIIVVDGGSEDATGAIAKPLADKVITSLPGRGRQMNAGARRAKGEVFLFLHADTRLPHGADDLIRGSLIQTGRCWGRFDVRLSGRQPLLRVIERFMNGRSRLTGIATGDQAIFIRREVFERLGGFPDIPLMEDIALSKMLKTQSRPLCLSTPVITSSRRWEQNGLLATVLLMWWLRLRFFLGADPSRLARLYYQKP